jgi:hypothetical protein
MKEHIRRLLSEIAGLEKELVTVIHEQQEQLHCWLGGFWVRCGSNRCRLHYAMKTEVFIWPAKSE